MGGLCKPAHVLVVFGGWTNESHVTRHTDSEQAEEGLGYCNNSIVQFIVD